MAREGKLENIDSAINVKYVSPLLKIATMHFEQRVCDVECIYIYGPTGVGKSRMAMDMIVNAYWKLSVNKWYDGY
ncbi:hypothetical protein HZS_2653 [Henneguya salminicola]|nr:hypothetical protein HZS_2653 [Henneguya salminicola]